MAKYKCVQGFVVPELIGYEDEATGNDFTVEAGEVWLREDVEIPMLTQENGRWLDITEDTIKKHFEKI